MVSGQATQKDLQRTKTAVFKMSGTAIIGVGGSAHESGDMDPMRSIVSNMLSDMKPKQPMKFSTTT